MSDDPETYWNPADEAPEPYPAPWIFKPHVLLQAVEQFVSDVIENSDDPDLAESAAKIRDLIPPVDSGNMLLVELPDPIDSHGDGYIWDIGDGTIRTDDPAQLPAEIRIKGFPFPVTDPRRMALALLAATAA